MMPEELVKELINCAKYTVAFQDVSPGSRIQKTKKRGEHFFTNPLFHKIVNYFLFEQVHKNLRQYFYPALRSSIRKKLIQDPDPGVKKNIRSRIQDRGSGSATLAQCTVLSDRN